TFWVPERQRRLATVHLLSGSIILPQYLGEDEHQRGQRHNHARLGRGSSGSDVIASAIEQPLIPAATCFNVAHANQWLWTHWSHPPSPNHRCGTGHSNEADSQTAICAESSPWLGEPADPWIVEALRAQALTHARELSHIIRARVSRTSKALARLFR